jgi:hypothetical protein
VMVMSEMEVPKLFPRMIMSRAPTEYVVVSIVIIGAKKDQ